MKPLNSFIVGSVKGFRGADVEFGGFGSHGWRGRGWWKKEGGGASNRSGTRWSRDTRDGERDREVVT